MEHSATERSPAEAPVLRDNQAESRFEIRVGGELAGFVQYHRRGSELINLIHTEVGDEFRGAGIAGQLARYSLDAAREEKLAVLPGCPYIENWIRRHPGYADLVPENRRADFGLDELARSGNSIRVWLPDSPEALGGIPEPMTADVWTGGEPLPASRDEVEVIVMPFGVQPDVIREVASLPRLRLIQLRSAGAEAVIPYVPDGVTVCNARGAHDPATSEWVVGVIFAQLRGLPGFVRSQGAGAWKPGVTRSVAGKHVLIVGYGSIGAAVERRLAGWDVTVERVARRARPRTRTAPEVMGLDELADALPRADVVVLLVPVTEATRGMADAQFLATMKDGALLVNAARGSIVDTGALLAELNAGRITAALDVTDPEPLPDGHPLWRAPGVLITPHIAGLVAGGIDRAHEVVRAQFDRYVRGEPLQHVIGAGGY